MSSQTFVGEQQGPGLNRYRADKEIQDNGFWNVSFGLNLPGKHPFWSQYAMVVFDLTHRPPQEPPLLCKHGMSHELHLYALDPRGCIDWDKSMYDQPQIKTLMPANLGYQFYASDNQVAFTRALRLVKRMVSNDLSPDADHRAAWNAEFKDGVSLVVNVFSEMAEAQYKTKH